MAFVPASQPENTMQLLDRSLNLYKSAFHKIFLVALVLSVVAFTPRIMALIYGTDLLKFDLVYHQLAQFLVEILSTIFFTAMLWDMRCVMANDKENLFLDFKTSLRKIPLLIGASIVESLIFFSTAITLFAIYALSLHFTHYNLPTTGLGIFLFILPILCQIIFNAFIFVLLVLYLPIIVTENKGIFSALLSSAKLVWHNIWRVIKLQLSPWIIYSAWLIIFKIVFGLKIHIYFFPLNNLTWSATIVHMLIFAFFVPWSAATLLVQLYDLELRKKLRVPDQQM
jgi:hypothetical protein